jgi:hypothetical protein
MIERYETELGEDVLVYDIGLSLQKDLKANKKKNQDI